MLIKPHGSTELSPRIVLGDAAEALKNEAATIPTLVLSSAAAANAVMLGAGYFNPLQGYMNREDAMAVATNLQTTDGLFWPVPVLNMTEQFDGSAGDRVALLDPNRDGNPLLAVMTVEAIEILSDDDMAVMTAEVFGTDDSNHPGDETFNSQGRVLL